MGKHSMYSDLLLIDYMNQTKYDYNHIVFSTLCVHTFSPSLSFSYIFVFQN